MKTGRFEASDGIGAELRAQLEAIVALPDDRIDTTDIPEVRDWSGAVRGRFFHPQTRRLTIDVDADVIDYFRAQSGEDMYPAAINRVLRAAMLRAQRRAHGHHAQEEGGQHRAKA